jgi:hypothetical protein
VKELNENKTENYIKKHFAATKNRCMYKNVGSEPKFGAQKKINKSTKLKRNI